MIIKKNLWFVSLFSVILVLSIFYVSMSEDKISSFVENEVQISDSSLVINESTELVSLRVASDEELQTTMNELKDTILSDTSSVAEKNDAYNELLVLSDVKADEEKIESILNKDFGVESFVKISSTEITIVVESDKNGYKDANKIIRRVQEEFKEDRYITVKFN